MLLRQQHGIDHVDDAIARCNVGLDDVRGHHLAATTW
jgi:hypothetical protein